MNHKILITGASGFVGRALCNYFLNQGYQVIGCGRNVAPPVKHPNFTYYAFELKEISEYQFILNDVDTVIHAAALAHQSDTAQPIAYFQINAELTKQLLLTCVKSKIKKFVFISSIKVLGERTVDVPFSEQRTPVPQDVYGRSKWFAEQYVQEIAEEGGIEWVIVRPPLVYGPDVKANFASLVRFVDKDRVIPLGSVENRRSFIAIDNLCDCIDTCVTHPLAKNEIFCVSDDDDQSTVSLILALSQARNSKSKLLRFPLFLLKILCTLLGKRSMYARLTESLQVDITKVKTTLNWRPALTFEQAIQKYFCAGATARKQSI